MGDNEHGAAGIFYRDVLSGFHGRNDPVQDFDVVKSRWYFANGFFLGCLGHLIQDEWMLLAWCLMALLWWFTLEWRNL